nr:hypothetical protein CFP56_12071 [Quercus suber]
MQKRQQTRSAGELRDYGDGYREEKCLSTQFSDDEELKQSDIEFRTVGRVGSVAAASEASLALHYTAVIAPRKFGETVIGYCTGDDQNELYCTYCTSAEAGRWPDDHLLMAMEQKRCSSSFPEVRDVEWTSGCDALCP